MRALTYVQSGFAILGKPWFFVERHPILLFACLLMLIGSGGTWVNMPLSGEYKLNDLQPLELSRQFKLVVLGAIGLICVTTARQMVLLRLLIMLGVTALFVSIALSLSMLDGERVFAYISESQSFRNIQHVLSLNAIPNAGRSVETALAFDAYHFKDRLQVAFGILGWGAKLSILMALALSIYGIFQVKRTVYALAVAVIMAAVLFFSSGLANVSLAYLKLNQGVRAINNGQQSSAIGMLDEALSLDPVLAYSPGFALLHSYLYYTTYGPDSPMAKAYLLEQRFSAGKYAEVVELNSLTSSATEIGQSQNQQSLPVAMIQAHTRTEQNITIDAFNRSGLLYLWRKDWSLAEQYFSGAMAIDKNFVSQLALLRIYMHTQQYSLCVATAEDVLEGIKNRSLSADVWSSMGDCLNELGRPTEARNAYQQSIALDSDKNYRAVKGLSGT